MTILDIPQTLMTDLQANHPAALAAITQVWGASPAALGMKIRMFTKTKGT